MNFHHARAVRVIPSSDEILVLDEGGTARVFGPDDILLNEIVIDERVLTVSCKANVQMLVTESMKVYFNESIFDSFEIPRKRSVISTCLSTCGNQVGVLYSNEYKILDAKTAKIIDSRPLTCILSQGSICMRDTSLVGVLQKDPHRVFVFENGIQTEWDISNLKSPFEIDLDSKGYFIISDTLADNVLVYTKAGNVKYIFRKDGSGIELLRPRFISIDMNDNIMICHHNTDLAKGWYSFVAWDADDEQDDEESVSLEEDSYIAEEINIQEKESIPKKYSSSLNKDRIQLTFHRLQNVPEHVMLVNPFIQVGFLALEESEKTQWQTVEAKELSLGDSKITLDHPEGQFIRLELWDTNETGNSFIGGINLEPEDLITSRFHILLNSVGESPAHVHVSSKYIKYSTVQNVEYNMETAIVANENIQDDKTYNEVVSELVLGVMHHSGYRRLEALHRLSDSSGLLHQLVSDTLGASGFRGIFRGLQSRHSKVRGASSALFESLLCRGKAQEMNQGIIMRELDDPGLNIGAVYFFYIPDEFRSQYLQSLDSETYPNEKEYVEYVSGILGKNQAQDGKDKLIRVTCKMGAAQALGFHTNIPPVTSKMLSWSQAKRLSKLCSRFHDLVQKDKLDMADFLNDPIVETLVGPLGDQLINILTPTITWEEFRAFFLFKTFEMKIPRSTKGSLVQDVEIMECTTKIRDRVVDVTVLATVSGLLEFNVMDCLSKVEFQGQLSCLSSALAVSKENLKEYCDTLWLQDADLSFLLEYGKQDSEEISRPVSLHARTKSSITFTNRTDSAASLYWVDYEGMEHLMGELAPGQEYGATTWISHVWICRGPSLGKLSLNGRTFVVASSKLDLNVNIRLDVLNGFQRKIEWLAQKSLLNTGCIPKKAQIVEKNFLPVKRVLEILPSTIIRHKTTSVDTGVEFISLPFSKSRNQTSRLTPTVNKDPYEECSIESSVSLSVRVDENAYLQVNKYERDELIAVAIVSMSPLKDGFMRSKAHFITVESLFTVKPINHGSLSLECNITTTPLDSTDTDNKILLTRLSSEKTEIKPVKCSSLSRLADAMSHVANLWNSKDRLAAQELLVERACDVIPELKFKMRNGRSEIIKAVKYVKIKQSDKSTMRLWKACEDVLRQNKNSSSSSYGNRELTEKLVSQHKCEMEKQLEDWLLESEQTIKTERVKIERRNQKDIRAQSKIRAERLNQQLVLNLEAEKTRLEENQAHGKWYREEQRLMELELTIARRDKMINERRMAEELRQRRFNVEEEQKRIQDAKRKMENDMYESRRRKSLEKLKNSKKPKAKSKKLWTTCIEVPETLTATTFVVETEQHRIKNKKQDHFESIDWELLVDWPQLPSPLPSSEKRDRVKFKKQLQESRRYQRPWHANS